MKVARNWEPKIGELVFLDVLGMGWISHIQKDGHINPYEWIYTVTWGNEPLYRYGQMNHKQLRRSKRRLLERYNAS